MKRFLSIVLLFLLALTSACVLRLGSPNRLDDSPAPTTIPLAETAQPVSVPEGAPPLGAIALPPGFTIGVYASGLSGPRMLAIGPDGHPYAAERAAGRIVRLPDRDGDGQVDRVEVAAEGLEAPSSLAFYRDGSLYVGETRRVLRLSDLDEQGVYRSREVIVDDLPRGGHNTRTVLFSPDWSTMYVSVGSSCNVCEEDDPRRAAILRYDPDGSRESIYASGLRNAVGMAIRPGTEDLWATVNGRDMLGDDLPPETIYQVQAGVDYGWPRCHAGRIPDPDFGGLDACQGVPLPMVEMQAHSAPLGLTFYTGQAFPEQYHGDLFVAFHGSWNRREPTGYKVVRILMQDGTPGAVQDFAAGWLTDEGSVWGRPVDVITGPDGGLYISDDSGGVIYRVYYP